MKKLIFKNFVFLFTATILLNGCGEFEETIYNPSPEVSQTLIKFPSSSTSLPVNAVGVSTITASVQVSTVSPSERTISVSIDESSTATSNQYSITDFVVPAGEYFGTATITGVYEELPALGAVSLVLNLNSISGSEAVIENGTLSVNIERFCPLVIADFYGTYTQLGGFDGGAPAARGDATITAGPVAGTLRIDNLYSAGRAGVIELDFSNPSSPKVIHRSEEFDVVFAVAGLGNTYTEDVLGDVDKNIFNSCSKEIKLFFYRRIAQPDGRYYGGSYEIILNKQ